MPTSKATTSKAPDELLRTIRGGNRFLLTSHVSPDGDAIGSELGLARLLRTLGKGAVIWNRDETPSVYRALPGAERIHTGPEPPSGWPDKFDGVIALECPGLDRTGLEEHVVERQLVNIDHHLGNQHYGVVNWVDPTAPAVGEMIFRLAQGLRIDLDADTANALYLTLVTDTGGFRFANATPEAFEAAAALVRAGARPEEVSRQLHESRSPASLRLLAELLGTVTLHAGGRVATAHLVPATYERAGASQADAEGLIDYPRSLAGVQAVALVRELPEGGVKVSLRSRGDVDVERIARQHGGGGHKNAAGYTLAEGDAAGAIAAAVGEIEAALDGVGAGTDGGS